MKRGSFVRRESEASFSTMRADVLEKIRASDSRLSLETLHAAFGKRYTVDQLRVALKALALDRRLDIEKSSKNVSMYGIRPDDGMTKAVYHDFRGESLKISEIAERTNVSEQLIRDRLNRGIDIERAVTAPAATAAQASKQGSKKSPWRKPLVKSA